MKEKLPILLILITASILIFANLGNQYLWQDEAETAVLAKNVLQYGYPKAFDGKNIVNPVIRTGFGPGYSWLYHPWGQFYITALSFKLFGASAFTARLPFALVGVFNILLLYLLAYRLTLSRFTAVCSSFLVTFSVPYLLLMRQCRYYAPALFLVLFILFFYVRFVEEKRTKDLFWLCAGFIALGYTVHGMFIPIFGAVALHYIVFNFKKETFFSLFAGSIVVILLVLPWFLYSNSAAHLAQFSLERLRKNLEFDIRMINKFIFPAVFFMSMYAVRVILRRRFSITLTSGEKKAFYIVLFVTLASLAAFSFAEERNFRYLVYLIPLFAIIESIILLRLVKFSRFLFIAFLAVSITTGVFNMGYANFLFPKYLYEITHDYDGPIEGIVKFLNANAREGETVKLIFEDIPIIFYTDLKVDNSQVYDKDHMPEWIVFRRGWHEQLGNNYYTEVQKGYKQHVLDYPDIKWENRPDDLDYHRFKTDTEAPGVIIFEKVGRK